MVLLVFFFTDGDPAGKQLTIAALLIRFWDFLANRKGHAAKTLHGLSAFVWPLIQDYSYLIPGADSDRDSAARRAFRWRIPASNSAAVFITGWPSGRKPDVMTTPRYGLAARDLTVD